MPESAAVAGAAQNAAGGITPKTHSKFPLSFSFYNTERFGEYTPFFVEEGISTDKLPFHSAHEVNTYTLKAPLLQSLLKKKDYFAVPMQAILPLNWEKFYTNPVIGQDVPDDSGLGVDLFWNKVEKSHKYSLNTLKYQLTVTPVVGTTNLLYLFRYLVFFEYFYSTGSLMTTLGISGNSFFHCNRNDGSNPPVVYTFDDVFDRFIFVIKDSISTFNISLNGSTYVVDTRDEVPNLHSQPAWILSFREFLEMLREDFPTFVVTGISYKTGFSDTAFASRVSQELGYLTIYPVLNTNSDIPQNDDSKIPLNLGRLWAYQLVCAHFYTNDHIDFVYSAELYRQYIQQLVTSHGTTIVRAHSFYVNGYEYIYDSLSAHYCSAILDLISNPNGGIYYYPSAADNIPDNLAECYAYIVALLHYKHSLRYMDYFTGARSQPLAVGDHEVDVNSSNKVDVLDMARGRMMTKFLQSVNRAGRRFGSYMKELFGKVPAYDYHNPMYLAHTSDVVGSNVNQNTGAGQRDANAFTSNMQSNASRYAFEFFPDRDCIVIGISYYDIPRVYTLAIERQNFNIDRFDMFNPYLQYVGDQPIYRAEIGSRNPDLYPFGYQNRDMQYKQRYNQGSGAFANPSTGLDNWIFVSDALSRQRIFEISPEFIRSFNCELDHFYTSLTGYANGSYFHFIVRYDNRQDATRPMAYAPVIA